MTFAKRWLLAFTVAFFLLANGGYPFDVIPGLGIIDTWMTKAFDLVIQPLARNVLHVVADGTPNGSGDTTWNYLMYAVCIVIAMIAATIWASIDRDRAHYERVRDLFRIYLRFALGAAMIVYGAAKVIQAQFPTPFLDRLVQTFGSASPMGILWTFMGTSHAYNVITGSAEMLSGILLTMRRTTFAGALLGIAVMANIVALNFCYDVPVKLYSTQLLLEAVILAAPGLRWLGASLFATEVPRASTAVLLLRTALVLAFVFVTLRTTHLRTRMFETHSPLRGIWNVDELTENGVARPPLTTDLSRWRRVIFDTTRLASIHLMSDTRLRYAVTLDEKSHKVTLKDRDNPKSVLAFAYARPDPRTLVLDGLAGGPKVHAVCHLSPLTSQSLLLTRGFHWINEYPFNH